MKRSDLIDKLAEKMSISNTFAEAIVMEIFSCMTDTLVTGNRIEIRGFGSFEIRDYNERSGRNPKTGEKIEVKPRKSPFFKVGKELKERIMAGIQL
jgi:integration host factor subunit beta